MYKETLKTKDLATKPKLSQDQVENKVNQICDAFLALFPKWSRPEDVDCHQSGRLDG
jgi:elongator complex protein 1